MQPDNNNAPPPNSLQSAFLTLARQMGTDIAADYVDQLKKGAMKGATKGTMDLRDLPAIADYCRLTHQRQITTLDQIGEDSLPCLLQLQKKRFYVAIDKQDSQILLLDPQGQEVWLDQEQLQPLYSGVIHQLTPTTMDNQSDHEKTDHLFEKRGFIKHWKTVAPRYYQVILATLLINLLTLAVPIFTHFVFDKVLPGYATDTLITISLGMAAILMVDFILRWLRSYYVDDACRIISRHTEFTLLKKIIQLEKNQLPASSTLTAQTVQDFARVKESISSSVLLAVLDIPFFLLFTLVIWLIGGPLVMVPLAIAALLLPMSWFSYRLINRRTGPQSHSLQEKNRFLHEVSHGLDVIRAMGASARILSRWRLLVTNAGRHDINIKQAGTLLNALVASASQIAVLLMLIMGVLLIQDASLPPGHLFACIILGSRAIAPLANLTMVFNRFSQSQKSLQQIKQLLNNNSVANNNVAHGHRLTDFTGNLSVENLSFRFPNHRDFILNTLNFQLKPGERLAVMGASGSGKTTLLELLQGNLSPSAGHIFVDNQDLAGINRNDYRHYLTIAQQRPMVFSGTLRSNLLMGNEAATRIELDRVCHIVGLDRFIRSCREGYDHPVNDRGMNLSGGQQQALCLARTLLHGGQVLMLDEPTSAFDNLSESLFCQRFPEFINTQQTLLLITHRASLLALVDRIIVLAEGAIVADGPREEVLARMNGVKQQNHQVSDQAQRP
ncbi:peptidase domain-containing ABC transporter [Endozoicomonas sp.]|uniref:peptidase domain-containing ABC transporter n=1 Tax=Endozoicomonas sp. TaxID=1892382 RepID=UPI00383A3884